MRKFFGAVLSAAMLTAGLTGCSKAQTGSDTITGTYAVEIQGYDWGCGVTKAKLTLDYPLDSVSADTFTVSETKQQTDFTSETFDVVENTADRTVTDAYLVDDDGKKTENASKNVVIEMSVDPNTGSPLLFTMSTQFNTWSDPYYLTVSLAKDAEVTSISKEVKSFKIDTELTGKTTSVDRYSVDSYKADDGVNYQYAHYEPADGSKTLVVWLHGMGEGGTEDTDPTVTLLANKAGTLADSDFQDAVGNANILVPQCPTYWMDADGKSTNFNNGGIQADGTSYYTESLMELIESYKKETGSTKVILAGCSNGGYMTMLMAMNYPDAFDAIVPISEALPNSVITDDEINAIKDIPMYFVYSNDDTTVDPTLHEIPTIQRLQAAGAKELYVSTSDHVTDLSGEYKDADGNAYQYMGHWSWIYFFNNQCDADGTKAFDFIADNVK
jgi:predicted peptidase